MPATVVVPNVGSLIVLGPAGVSVHKPLAPGITFPSKVTAPLQVVLLVAVATIALLLIFTSSNALHMPWFIVQRKVLTPGLRLLIPEVFSNELAMIPVPMVCVHAPVPSPGGTVVGSIPTRLVKLTQMFWSGPALAITWLLVIVIEADEPGHAPLVMVHVMTFAPGDRLFTVVW